MAKGTFAWAVTQAISSCFRWQKIVSYCSLDDNDCPPLSYPHKSDCFSRIIFDYIFIAASAFSA